MKLKPETYTTPYSPVEWVHRETIQEMIDQRKAGKIFYFCQHEGICEAEGRILEMKEFKNDGIYILVGTDSKVRIDRIITLYGKPGAAYDEYDGYANSCMSCLGGYEPDEL